MILIEGEETAWHHRTWWSEGVADLTLYEDQEKIPIGILVRGGGGFDPFCTRAGDKILLGGLIPYHDRLKVRPQSILSSEGVAGLLPHENKL